MAVWKFIFFAVWILYLVYIVSSRTGELYGESLSGKTNQTEQTNTSPSQQHKVNVFSFWKVCISMIVILFIYAVCIIHKFCVVIHKCHVSFIYVVCIIHKFCVCHSYAVCMSLIYAVCVMHICCVGCSYMLYLYVIYAVCGVLGDRTWSLCSDLSSSRISPPVLMGVRVWKLPIKCDTGALGLKVDSVVVWWTFELVRSLVVGLWLREIT